MENIVLWPNANISPGRGNMATNCPSEFEKRLESGHCTPPVVEFRVSLDLLDFTGFVSKPFDSRYSTDIRITQFHLNWKVLDTSLTLPQ
jgi:hypothetical protein